ncbi:MAG: class I SAM-dependent methyltransferase [Verrucomicrobia bacterium]|nr:class I SAM-dependent methyltransferase [Verrucomicrobiota bacterium]
MFLILWFFAIVSLKANDKVHLDSLSIYDPKLCAEVLDAADLSSLWNSFLEGQAHLFFGQEADWLSGKREWVESQNVLELGSGNGSYLSRLSEAFSEKKFLGLEIQPSLVEQSKASFARPGLFFVAGDAEEFHEEYRNQFDVVLYRLTLQHLKEPRLSLKLAHEYLKEGGHVFIIEACDAAKVSSHRIHSFEEASRQQNRTSSKGNRRISMEILNELQDEASFYQIAHTSLDVNGNRLEKGIRFESEEDRKRYFNHALLFLSILKKGYGVLVDLSEAYSELQVYLEDENSWVCPGIHLLVLRKI